MLTEGQSTIIFIFCFEFACLTSVFIIEAVFSASIQFKFVPAFVLESISSGRVIST